MIFPAKAVAGRSPIARTRILSRGASGGPLAPLAGQAARAWRTARSGSAKRTLKQLKTWTRGPRPALCVTKRATRPPPASAVSEPLIKKRFRNFTIHNTWSGGDSNSRPLPCEGIPVQLGSEVSRIPCLTSVHSYGQQRLTAVPFAKGGPEQPCVPLRCFPLRRDKSRDERATATDLPSLT